MSNKDYLFAVNIGHYNNFNEYNKIMSRRRQHEKIYKENEGKEWKWDSKINRIKFDEIRILSVTYGKYSRFAIGGLILHRLISLIDVIYLERLDSDLDLETSFSPQSGELKFNILIAL